MVTIKKSLQKIRDFYRLHFDGVLELLVVAAALLFIGFLHGYNYAKKKSYEPMILTPGQTAVLLEDVQVIARIPYQGDELYEGPVVFQKGSMVVKPRVEP